MKYFIASSFSEYALFLLFVTDLRFLSFILDIVLSSLLVQVIAKVLQSAGTTMDIDVEKENYLNKINTTRNIDYSIGNLFTFISSISSLYLNIKLLLVYLFLYFHTTYPYYIA